MRKRLTIQRTRSSVALMALTVTFRGGCAGGAWMVWNSLVGSDGSDIPTTFLAINLSRYVVNGTKSVTVMVLASGSDISNTVNQEEFLAVCPSTIHFVIDELPSNPEKSN